MVVMVDRLPMPHNLVAPVEGVDNYYVTVGSLYELSNALAAHGHIISSLTASLGACVIPTTLSDCDLMMKAVNASEYQGIPFKRVATPEEEVDVLVAKLNAAGWATEARKCAEDTRRLQACRR
jgi:hypothetical protein